MSKEFDAAFDSLVQQSSRNGEVNDNPTEPTSWLPIDLREALKGGDAPAPNILAREDGECLLYAGRTHSFAGESESLKTWAALVAVAQTLQETDGGSCLWIDFEDDERGVAGRLQALGVDDELVLTRFVYIRPEEPLHARDGRSTRGEVDFSTLLSERSFSLCVIDGVTEAMTTEGMDLLSNADVAKWSRLLPKRIAATGAAVVQIDHLPKSKDNQGRYAIGGQHKLAGLTGAAYRFNIRKSLSRARLDQTDGVTGRVVISVMKDRPGYVRSHTDGDQVAVLELTAYPDGGVTPRLILPSSSTGPPDMRLLARILERLKLYPGSTQRGLTENVDGKTDATRAALSWMAAQEPPWIAVAKVGNSHQHTLTDEGHEQLET